MSMQGVRIVLRLIMLHGMVTADTLCMLRASCAASVVSLRGVVDLSNVPKCFHKACAMRADTA
jgi:hypothetical protein